MVFDDGAKKVICRKDEAALGEFLAGAEPVVVVGKLVVSGMVSSYAEAEAGEGERRNQFPLALPSMAQYRTTRRIVGQATMTDGQQGQHVPNSVGLVADWRRPGEVWEIPYGALVPQKVSGLLAAGRCISSEDDAWEVTRVIPPAALTGQVAGLAAAIAAYQRTTPEELEPRAVQSRLREEGIPCHLGDVDL